MMRTGNRQAAALWVLLLAGLLAFAAPVSAGTDLWTTTGPLTSGTVDPVIRALALAPDGTLYAGTGSGRVWSYTMTFLNTPTTPTPAVTTSSSGSSTSGGSDSDSSGTGRQGSGSEKTVDVNIGGSTAVTGAVVTGTDVRDMVVTVISSDNSGEKLPRPPGRIVYVYLLITPLHYGTITSATISFTMPQSWLDEKHVSPQDIVMYHYTGGQWVALPTTVVKTGNGHVYFTATTPSFSWFAIGVTENPSAVATTGGSAKTPGYLVGGAAVEPVLHETAAVARPPTTTSPAPALPGTGFPLATITIIGAGCVALIGSGWYVRRWLRRRQNPALFREYD